MKRIDGGLACSVLGIRADVHPRDVAAFIHPTEASALRSVKTNRDTYGHPTFGPILVEGGWLEAVDLRPALAEHGCQPTDPRLPDRRSRA